MLPSSGLNSTPEKQVKTLIARLTYVHSSETSVNIYMNFKNYEPGDSTLHSHCRENLKPKIIFNSK
jgi:hypothetical protein